MQTHTHRHTDTQRDICARHTHILSTWLASNIIDNAFHIQYNAVCQTIIDCSCVCAINVYVRI